MRPYITRLLIVGIFLILVVICPACKKSPGVYFGILQGDIILEPLCPEPPCNLSPSDLVQFWANRQVLIYTADTSKVISRITLTPDAIYQVALEEGNYIIDINYYGDDISPSVPATITIMSGFTAQLDIDIDTNLK